MSKNPFAADSAVPVRLEKVSDAGRAALREAAETHLSGHRLRPDNNLGGVIEAGFAQELVSRFDLASLRDLMILLLDAARQFAHPPISDFFVGAVGLEAGTGNLILGGNVEFPGTNLAYTLHGEGFVATRAFNRGVGLEAIAIGEAHPCAHCRQYLSEFSFRDRLTLIDPLGHTLALEQLYPWPFDPAYLGQTGAQAGHPVFTDLAFAEPASHPDAEALLARGKLSHSPYSKCPGAVVLTLTDGQKIGGAAVESVAFNPTIQPLQAALVDLLAHGYAYSDIESAVLGRVAGGAVDYGAGTRELLSAVAPAAELTVLDWRSDGHPE